MGRCNVTLDLRWGSWLVWLGAAVGLLLLSCATGRVSAFREGVRFAEAGQWQAAIAKYEQALAEFRAAGNKYNMAAAHQNLGRAYEELREYEKAVPHLAEASILWGDVGEAAKRGNALILIGSNHFALGRYTEARDKYQQADEVLRAAGARENRRYTVVNLAAVHAILGEYDEALGPYREALEIAQASGDAKVIAFSHYSLGLLHRLRKEYPEALAQYEETARLCRDSVKPTCTDVADSKAEVLLDMGRGEEARTIFVKLNNNSGLGRYHLERGEYSMARDAFRKALAEAQEDRSEQGVLGGWIGLGRSHEGLDELEEASKNYQQAAEYVERQMEKLPSAARTRFMEAEICGFPRGEATLGLARIEQREREKREAPCELALTPLFADQDGIFPNSSIDAGEESAIEVEVVNRGPGHAFAAQLQVEVAHPGLVAPTVVDVGDLGPDGSGRVRVPLRADLDLLEGAVEVRLLCAERRGYTSKRIQLVIPALRLRAPALAIRESRVDDGVAGLARGNGNGIPESGETVEVTVYVANEGEGPTVDAVLRAGPLPAGLRWIRQEAPLGTLPAGSTAKARLAFEIPETFAAREIVFGLRATDRRGVGEAGGEVALRHESRAPNLLYALRLLSEGRETTTLVNGGDFDVELAVRNNGSLPARNVTVALAGKSDSGLAATPLRLGEIGPGAAAPPQRVRFSLQRTFNRPELTLDVTVEQEAFPGVQDSVTLPVSLCTPRLAYLAQLGGRRGANILERREKARIRLQVRNEGTLAAEAVKVALVSGSDMLRVEGHTEVFLGAIPAGASADWVEFDLRALGLIPLGDHGLEVRIFQQDFPEREERYAVFVVEEEAERHYVRGDAGAPTGPGAEDTAHRTPVVKIIRPLGNTAVEADSVLLAARVIGSGLLDAVRVTVNDRPVNLSAESSTIQGRGEAEIRALVPLAEGENTVVVSAINTNGMASAEVVKIRRHSEVDVSVAPARGTENPSAVGVVIGVSRYKDPDVFPVDFARRDAEAMRDYLIYTMGFREDRVISVFDEEATTTRLREIFRSDLMRLVKPDGSSDMFVFFSGHGVPDTEEFRQYLMTHDARPSTIQFTGYEMNELYRDIRALKTRNVTVALDACFSGLSERGSLLKGMSPALIKVKHSILEIPSAVVLSASAKSEVSNWYQEKGHGIFTYYFLNGLRGNADLDGNRTITAGEMETYLLEKVPGKAQGLAGRQQTPQVVGAKEAVLVAW